jgi:glycosyltransferase involved in cell wall biosynthesis
VGLAVRLSAVHPTEGTALPSLLVIIPALNEEETVAAVVRSVLDTLDGDVLVIDDGSHDHTASIATAAGALVLRHPFNLGVGAALRTGFRYASEQGYEIAVQVDADGQHEVSDAKRLVELVASGQADLAVGSRFGSGSDYEVSGMRRMSMRLLSRRVSRYLGTPIQDTTSGFRAFSAAAVSRFAQSYPSAYLSDTVEALLMAGDWGLTVVELPVQMHARKGGEPSANFGRSLYHLVRLGLVIVLHRFRRPLFRHVEPVA